MKASHPDDPLRRLGHKALRRLARQHKIKHFYRKSPAALRRAIRRAQERQQPAVPLTAEELAEQKRAAELKAFEEHRLRYLYMPSRFVHKGTHAELLLEKDDEIDLPDFYQEDALVALPVDPYRFYVYWDFAEETLYDVRSWLSEDYPFVLRLYDVTALVFDGSNAHARWDSPCHPLVREWYLSAPVNGRDILVELGVMQGGGFRPLLRANPIYIPPAGVASVTGDIFAHFVPTKPRETDPELRPVTEFLQPRPETSAHLFFQEYVPTPIQLNPPPPPRQILSRSQPQPAETPRARPTAQAPQPQQQAPLFDTREQAQQAGIPDPEPVRVQIEAPAPEPVPLRMEPVGGSVEWTEQDVIRYLSEGGSLTLQQWLGLPHEIRWLSDMPIGMSQMFFQHWLTDPYDQAMMISYSIWPWELTEYMPLGASDQILRKFLGASLFSWFRPGGSERMIWWQQPGGASEGIRWQRPMGASELSWSGSLQTEDGSGRSAWTLWPAPASGRGLLNDSGAGLFGGNSGHGLFGTGGKGLHE